MTKEYTKKLIELAEELHGLLSVEIQVARNEDAHKLQAILQKANQLIGFIQALKETE